MKTIIIVMLLLNLSFFTSLFSQENQSYQITKLVDGIYELKTDGGGFPVKVIASVGKDGILIVDSGQKESGSALIEALKTFAKGMPRIIINTHSHIEHIGGNTAFTNNPLIIGHQKLRDRYTDGLYIFNEFPESALPNVTLSDSLNIFFNEEEIKIKSFPGAHDNSDIIVWFTKSKIVCTAALCNGHHFPSVDGETGNISRYPEVVSRLINLLPEDVMIIPGHADNCTMNEFWDFYDMLNKTSAIVKHELEKGKDVKQLIDEDILADWKEWETYATREYLIKLWTVAFRHPQNNTPLKTVYSSVYHTLNENGIEAAIELYNILRKEHFDEYDFNEKTSMRIGSMLASNGKSDEGAKFLELSVSENPDSEAAAISHYYLGDILWNKKEKEAAKEHFLKYLAKFPEDNFIEDRLKELESKE